MEWMDIESLPRDKDGFIDMPHGVIFGWRFGSDEIGWSWEYGTDEFNDCATHWMPLPPPPIMIGDE